MEHKARGFTLVELMIVLAIVGILAAIGYPAYRDQVRDTRRADCTGVLMGAANSLERYYTEHGSYTGATAGTHYTNRCPIDGGTITYNVDTSALTATSYTLIATRAGAQVSDQCGNLTLTNTGARGVDSAGAGFTADDCW